MMTRCSTVLIAARLRSTLHDPHASRTRSDGGISLMTVADPDSRSYSRRAVLIASSVRCRISSQSTRSITPPARSRRASARTSSARLISASSSARRGAAGSGVRIAQRLLHARGFQRIQHRAGHVFLQQHSFDRGAAASVRAGHARVLIRPPVRRLVAVVQAPAAAFRAGGDTGQQMRLGAHRVLTAGRIGEHPHQPLMGIGIDDRRPLRRVLAALPCPQPRQPRRGHHADPRGRIPLPARHRLDPAPRSSPA